MTMKVAARYASDPAMPQGPGFPMKPNRFSGLMPLQAGGQFPPNPLAQLKPQAPALATEAGIQQAVQKVGGSHQFGAMSPLRRLLGFEYKSADTSGGHSSAPAAGTATGSSSSSSSSGDAQFGVHGDIGMGVQPQAAPGQMPAAMMPGQAGMMGMAQPGQPMQPNVKPTVGSLKSMLGFAPMAAGVTKKTLGGTGGMKIGTALELLTGGKVARDRDEGVVWGGNGKGLWGAAAGAGRDGGAGAAWGVDQKAAGGAGLSRAPLGLFAAVKAALAPTPGLTSNQPPPMPGMTPPPAPGGPAGAASLPPPAPSSPVGAGMPAPPAPQGAGGSSMDPNMLQQPPTAPMSDAPPMPLPVNPRPAPPSPKDSMQAQGEANILSLLEHKNQPLGPAALMTQNMATGDNLKTGFEKGGDDDDNAAPGGGTFLRRGWQWKALQKSQGEGLGDWFPRVFRTEHTPLTELLASPGKQSLLGAGAGALAGGVAGGLGSAALGASPGVGGTAGTGLGALLGGVLAYRHRRHRNDEVGDAMRHLPTGSTIGDWAKLQGKAAAQDNSQPQRSATGESHGLTYQHKPDHYLQGQAAWASAGQYLHRKPKVEPNPFHGEHAGKQAAALTPFAAGFYEACAALGLSDDQVQATVKKAGAEFGAHVSAELEKAAGGLPPLKPLLQAGADWAGRTFKPLVQAGERGASPAVQHAFNLRQMAPQLGRAEALAASRTAPAVQAASRFGSMGYHPLLQEAGVAARQVGGAATRAGLPQSMGGAALGGFWGDDVGLPGTAEGPAGLKFNLPGAAMGAAAFNPRLNYLTRRYGGHAGAAASDMVRGSIGAGFGGSMGDLVAGQFGVDTGGGLGRAGAIAGAGAGGLRGLGRYGASRLPAGAPLQQGANWLNRNAGAGIQAIDRFGTGVGQAGMDVASYPFRKLWGTAGGAGKATPLFMAGAASSGPQQFGRAAGLAGMGAMGLGAGYGMLKNKAHEMVMGTGKVDPATGKPDIGLAGEAYNYVMPAVQDDAGHFMDQYLSSRGMLNQQGHFDPTMAFQQHGGVLGSVLSSADSLFQRVGLNPTEMSPLQKLMILGGTGAMGGGALTGSPMMAGAGGMSLLGGLLPHLMHQQGGQGQQGPQGPAVPPGIGQQVSPRWRDEWQVQQRLNQPQAG